MNSLPSPIKIFFIDHRNIIIPGGFHYAVNHHHDAYEIVLLVESQNEMSIQDHKYDILSRQLYFIPPYSIHRLFYKVGTRYHRYLLQFEHDFICELLSAASGEFILGELTNCETPVLSLNSDSYYRVKTTFANLLKLYRIYSDKPAKTTRAQLQFSLGTALLDIYDIYFSDISDENSHFSSKMIKNATTYINENYMGKVTVDQIAEALHVSKFHLCHKFKKATGESIIEFLQRTRIEQAQKMLAEERQSIAEACYDCGFNNIQHFYSVFKKLTNSTPGKFVQSQYGEAPK